ncbi:hypothetical protein DPMN_130452 [Dreissena polymorpha]|uniref:Uncharacterized protein n=1 Tax=Dreissena polymorpha TaxID=45954 RepID=A0A9D4JYE0_DREPO|nr:hypothetical protein DPMN_130427 [Dreissena polymorpha]KAH3828477.1 hypothetical protein DPMN_130452 [Dreissena polymorpha]
MEITYEQRCCGGVEDVVFALRSGVRGFDSYSGNVLIISSIDTKYGFFLENGLDSVHICLLYSKDRFAVNRDR